MLALLTFCIFSIIFISLENRFCVNKNGVAQSAYERRLISTTTIIAADKKLSMQWQIMSQSQTADQARHHEDETQNTTKRGPNTKSNTQCEKHQAMDDQQQNDQSPP